MNKATICKPQAPKRIKLNTVNVIEITNGEFQFLRAFADNPKGNKRAEEMFRQKIETFEELTKGVVKSDEEDFENYLEDGIYDVFPGITLILSHSI